MKQKIEQLTVFLENKPGELLFLTEVLREAKISLRSIQLADSTDFGLARIIVNNTAAAKKTLEDKGLSVRISEVFGVHIEDQVGSFHEVVALLSNKNINILYCYSFYRGRGGTFIFSVSAKQFSDAVSCLLENGMQVLNQDDL